MAAELGDFVTDRDRTRVMEQSLQVGKVLRLFCEFTTPRKDKYLALVHLADYPLFLVINSRIPRLAQSNAAMLKCQVPISAADHGFLDHDSYVNCAQVVSDFTLRGIKAQLLSSPGRVVGELSDSTRQQIVCAVRDADTITPHYQNLIIASLS